MSPCGGTACTGDLNKALSGHERAVLVDLCKMTWVDPGLMKDSAPAVLAEHSDKRNAVLESVF